MKIIFLDFDGVLNTASWLRRQAADWMSSPKGKPYEKEREIDPSAVARLNQITEKTGAKIVVSSSWREDYSLEELRTLLRGKGCTGDIIGVTPDLSARSKGGIWMAPSRGRAIQTWLEQNTTSETSFIIIDDASVKPKKRLVRTNLKSGLQDSHVKQAIALLTGE
jgi:hypothetical protein